MAQSSQLLFPVLCLRPVSNINTFGRAGAEKTNYRIPLEKTGGMVAHEFERRQNGINNNRSARRWRGRYGGRQQDLTATAGPSPRGARGEERAARLRSLLPGARERDHLKARGNLGDRLDLGLGSADSTHSQHGALAK